MKQIKGWAGSWASVIPEGFNIARVNRASIKVFVGPNAEADCAREYQDPVPVILKLDIEKQRKVRGKER